MTDLCEVVITAPDPEWLKGFSRKLVELRLCASAHNFAPIRSIYRWRGDIYERTEGRVSLHTRRDRVAEIVALAKQEHPYEVPGISTRTITDGNLDYLEWIMQETSPDKSRICWPRLCSRAATLGSWTWLNHRVHREALLDAAVANNALWCDAVCRSHGYPGVFSARLWISAHHDLEFYPNVITLRPEVTAPEATPARHQTGRLAVKDSFARLDLAADGLTVLFEAEWITGPPAPAGPVEPGLSWAPVTDAVELGHWQTAWAQGGSLQRPWLRPELLADPRCAIMACRRDGELAGGVIAYSAAGVTGMSNLFGAGLPAGQLWAGALRAVAAFRPDLSIVGYEHGTGLAAARQADCEVLGPLRIWTRNSAP